MQKHFSILIFCIHICSFVKKKKEDKFIHKTIIFLICFWSSKHVHSYRNWGKRTQRARIAYLGLEYGMGPQGQSMVRVPKKTISLFIRWTPSLEHDISKLNGRFILKVFFFHTYIHTLLNYYFIHNISNLNELKNS